MSRTKQEPKRAGFTFGELKMFFLVAKINLGIEEVGKNFRIPSGWTSYHALRNEYWAGDSRYVDSIQSDGYLPDAHPLVVASFVHWLHTGRIRGPRDKNRLPKKYRMIEL